MKKIFLILSIALIGGVVLAQDLKIKQGASATIKMKAGSAANANWSVNGGAATTGATLTRTWNEAVGNQTLTVTPLSPSPENCPGLSVNYTIEVFITIPPTDPNITAASATIACPINANNASSTATVNLTLVNFPASAYTVTYSVGSLNDQTVNIASGVTSFTVDANAAGITAGNSSTLTISRFQVSGQAPVVLGSSSPTATVNVSATPVINGIEF